VSHPNNNGSFNGNFEAKGAGVRGSVAGWTWDPLAAPPLRLHSARVMTN
jgi:hypothetical protein